MATAKTPTFIAKIPLRWRDMDAYGHVNNSTYFTFFEQARVMWWQEINVLLNNAENGPVVITASCVFLKPLHYPNDLEIHLFSHTPGRSSFIIDYAVYSQYQPKEKFAEGSTKMVWVDHKKNVSMPFPQEILNHLQQNS